MPKESQPPYWEGRLTLTPVRVGDDRTPTSAAQHAAQHTR